MSIPTYRVTTHAKMTQVTVGVEVLEILIATRMQRHPREATETIHLAEVTGTWMGRLLKEIRTASATRTADTTDPDAHAAEALSTMTTGEQGCRIARRTSTRGRCCVSIPNSECVGAKERALSFDHGCDCCWHQARCCKTSRHEARFDTQN